MTLQLPCEYCGTLTPWDLSYCVPACCPDCESKPLMMAAAWLAFTVGVAVLGALAWMGVNAW